MCSNTTSETCHSNSTVVTRIVPIHSHCDCIGWYKILVKVVKPFLKTAFNAVLDNAMSDRHSHLYLMYFLLYTQVQCM